MLTAVVRPAMNTSSTPPDKGQAPASPLSAHGGISKEDTAD